MLAVAFGWHFVTADWPYPLKVTACVTALFFAGYYLWRIDHLRLVPKFRLGEVGLRWINLGVSGERRRYVYLQVECETEGEVKNCRGQLLRVSKWIPNPAGGDGDGQWEVTHLNETHDLLWSYVDQPRLDLEPGTPRQLNIFYVHNRDRRMLTCSQYNPALELAPSERYKLDVRIAGDECLSKRTSIELAVGNEWYELEISKK